MKSVAVTAPDGGTAPTVQVGSTVQLRAVATFTDDSTLDVTSTASWSSDTTQVAGIDANGLVSGTAAGTSLVTAEYRGVVSTGVTVTVTS